MKNVTQTLIKYTVWALIFAATSYVYATGTFTEPVGGPQDGNTDAPINVGPAAQTKAGNFGAASFCDANGSNCISASTIVNTSTTNQTKTGPLTTTGFTSLSFGHIGTNLSVGDPVVNPSDFGLKGFFNGNVGATKYCGTTGTNCIKTSNPQTIFLPYSQRYTKLSNTFTTTNGTSHYDGNMSITETTLKAQVAALSGETRNIAGLIISYDLDMGIHSSPGAGQVSGTSAAKDLWYNVLIGNQFNSNLNSLYIEDTKYFYYDESATLLSGGASGTVVIYDTVTNGDFRIVYRIKRNAATNLTGSMAFTFKATVVGYILE